MSYYPWCIIFTCIYLEYSKGYFTDDDKCIPCPNGTYSDTDNVKICTPCPEGLITSQEGSTNSSQCHMGNSR